MIVNKPQAVNNNLYISSIKEVTTQEEINLIRKCATQWEKAAAGKITYFKKDSNKVQIAKDAKYVSEAIQFELKSRYYSVKTIKNGENAVFAAYDNRGRLQGVALVSFKGGLGYDNLLDEIIINPERIQSIGKREAIKGTGTKLVQAVANKVLMKNGEQNLGTLSLPSAIQFYLKLGFKDICPGSGANSGPRTEEMRLDPIEMKQLCLKKV